MKRWPNHACRRPPVNPPCPPLFQRRQLDGADTTFIQSFRKPEPPQPPIPATHFTNHCSMEQRLGTRPLDAKMAVKFGLDCQTFAHLGSFAVACRPAGAAT
jgi:hypothetical protein